MKMRPRIVKKSTSLIVKDIITKFNSRSKSRTEKVPWFFVDDLFWIEVVNEYLLLQRLLLMFLSPIINQLTKAVIKNQSCIWKVLPPKHCHEAVILITRGEFALFCCVGRVTLSDVGYNSGACSRAPLNIHFWAPNLLVLPGPPMKLSQNATFADDVGQFNCVQ